MRTTVCRRGFSQVGRDHRGLLDDLVSDEALSVPSCTPRGIPDGPIAKRKDTYVAVDGDLSHRLDRSSPMPLWAQLHADLVQRISAGEFGEDFPGENALSTAYGVSRHTVREALRQLRQDKVLIAERGRATRLADVPAIPQPSISSSTAVAASG